MIAVTVAGLLVPPAAVAGGLAPESSGKAAWSFSLASGYDTYIHTFPLANEDTTETISEWTAILSAEGRSRGKSRHHWRLRPELSLGSELLRERLQLGYQFRPDSNLAAFRLDARWQGRQYRGGTDYVLSSDNNEGRAVARWILAPAGLTATELRAFGSYLKYKIPSTLEIDHRELGGAIYLRSGPAAARRYAVGARLARRAYPDSTALDRTVLAGEGEYDVFGLDGISLRAYHRSERRTIRQDEVRPSAWMHWSELDCSLPVGAGFIDGELHSEIWEYDTETAAYFDSWRLAGAVAYRGGDILTVSWSLGLALERLGAAADSPEGYTQAGIRGGLESYGHALAGSITLEYGHRDYGYEALDWTNSTDLVSMDFAYSYSDFNYWEIWLMGSWSLARDLSFDVMANYQPESHTEQTDDSAVAFGSARMAHRW